MTKSPQNVPDVGIELGAACMPSGHASDRATAPGRHIWTQVHIYGFTCTECVRVVYVHETGRQLKERIEEHLRDIRFSRDKPVAIQFNSSNRSINNVQVLVLERVPGQPKALRLIRESAWINKLSTKISSGLNSKEVRQMERHGLTSWRHFLGEVREVASKHCYNGGKK